MCLQSEANVKKKSNDRQSEMDGLLNTLEKVRESLKATQRRELQLIRQLKLQRIKCARLFVLVLTVQRRLVNSEAKANEDRSSFAVSVKSLEESVRCLLQRDMMVVLGNCECDVVG